MICPHCQSAISDDSVVCPACGTPLSSSGTDSEFIFCEGCGARLTPQDRSCPKCGRPAPGILSADSAASDLAAGKTASFRRLTPEDIAASIPEPKSPAPPSIFGPAIDASATNVLSVDALSAAAGETPTQSPRANMDAPASEDTYTRKKPRHRAALIAAVAAVVLGVGAWFVWADPLGVMPGFYEQFSSAAHSAFPTREDAPATAAADDASSDEGGADGPADEEDKELSDDVLSDEAALSKLKTVYQAIVAQHDDALGSIISDYNGAFIDPDLAVRKQASSGAYAARDVLDAQLAELKNMKVASDSAYTDDIQNLTQLAEWVRQRIDIYCASWDISLSYTDERPAPHKDEILAPLRDRAGEDDEARQNFYAHYREWDPANN